MQHPIMRGLRPSSIPASDQHRDAALPFVGQVDWISGFVAGSAGLEIELAVTPLHRRLEFNERGELTSYVGTRAGQQVQKRCPLWALTRFELDTHIIVEHLQRTRRLVVHTDRYERTLSKTNAVATGAPLMVRDESLQYTTEIVDIQDTTSMVLTYSDLQRELPDAAKLIRSRSTCPDHIAFFVTHNRARIIIIPASEVLRVCYNPNTTLLESLTGERVSEVASAVESFDGLTLGSSSRRAYPFRMLRSSGLAQFELEQLMPRACAYARLHNGKLPILIRPPCRGRVAVRGDALIERRRSRSIVVFVVLRGFESPFPLAARDRLFPSFGTSHFAFAPLLWGRRFENNVELPTLGATAKADSIKNAERYEIRFFHKDAREFEDGYTWKASWRRWLKLLYPGLHVD